MEFSPEGRNWVADGPRRGGSRSTHYRLPPSAVQMKPGFPAVLSHPASFSSCVWVSQRDSVHFM